MSAVLSTCPFLPLSFIPFRATDATPPPCIRPPRRPYDSPKRLRLRLRRCCCGRTSDDDRSGFSSFPKTRCMQRFQSHADVRKRPQILERHSENRPDSANAIKSGRLFKFDTKQAATSFLPSLPPLCLESPLVFIATAPPQVARQAAAGRGRQQGARLRGRERQVKNHAVQEGGDGRLEGHTSGVPRD